MNRRLTRPLPRCACIAALLTCSPGLFADGMIPETSVVIVYEGKAEAAIKVTNSDQNPALLHVTLEHIPEDKASLLFVTPPIARVEAGESQLVRFILSNPEPLTTQRLKRVIFEGLAQSTQPAPPGEARVSVNVRQNLPVILHPKGLAKNAEPWKGLHWSLHDGQLTVANPTPYVVRLSQELHSLPSQTPWQLPRSYVLPGDTLTLPGKASAAADGQIRFTPATVYGFAVGTHEATLNQGAP
ncbi:fimbria/pilus periplasmic chaperone [Pseudomonas sp. CFBP 8770]|uniref:fimbria/pilus chaperone family protein n=1 Tax=unclassified Pseudomonas TaxID=196821 RepID=UPI00178402DB|nr:MULTISPECIES: fimbria/pilus chaperone family protein [unclassified Pseudomonas]MBD8474166.1 fimbria/pilus periplasmic chaperone [Pseudomonas sp. CFBP 8773]MBD8647296.1 fimbria/pilus periplasmic chaperone [Pseudomonas sp. CFBP 8770]